MVCNFAFEGPILKNWVDTRKIELTRNSLNSG
jgi:hypothetical protein